MRRYICLQLFEVPGITFEYKLEILVRQEMLLKVKEINISARGKRYSNPITGPDGPRGFQEVEAPRFQDSRHKKLSRLSVLNTGRLYPQKIFPVLISVRG